MNSKTAVTAIVGRIKKKKKASPSKALTFGEAADEIGKALNIEHEAATMTLYGLCATGNVRWIDNQGELVDEDKCTIANFYSKPAVVLADDVRSFLTDWSHAPQPSRREAVIAAMIAEGLIPPRTIDWKTFCNLVRERCNARLDAKGRPPFGFGDKQIQRKFNELRDK
jgi:hypothetical protein